VRCLEQCKASGAPLHFIGLLSDGNVHSHIDHLLAMLERAASEGIARARVHVLTDGRDVGGRTALTYIDRLEATLGRIRQQNFDYRIASGGGRMHVTMDRYESDWSIVQRGWATHVRGDGRHFSSAREAIETLYEEGGKQVNDQHLPPFVIAEDGRPVGRIEDGSAVIFFNFRGDRALEITRAFEDEVFTAFDRGPRPEVMFAGMMQYDGDLRLPSAFLVEPPEIDRSMGELLAASGCRQLALAETHKFGHVTYFWNGNRSAMFDPALERYVEVPSGPGALEERPWMKAAEVTDTLVAELDSGEAAGQGFDLVRLNYANADMVGHTGDLRASILAVEAVDLCIARLLEETRRRSGVLVVTADHGNADQMFDGEGDARRVRTSHSLNPVPFVIYDPRVPGGIRVINPGSAGLANVAATVIELLGFRAPEDYEISLIA
jgi:2,3-bisphosphoglycerate-independent phosphoglycerate mutase